MTEIAIIDWFGRWGHLFSLKTLLYFLLEELEFMLKLSSRFGYFLSSVHS